MMGHKDYSGSYQESSILTTRVHYHGELTTNTIMSNERVASW